MSRAPSTPAAGEVLLDLEVQLLPQLPANAAMTATIVMLSTRCLGVWMVFILHGRRVGHGDGRVVD
jgi:hypothetical protein